VRNRACCAWDTGTTSEAAQQVDHLLGQRLGARSRLTFYAGIVDGYYLIADLPKEAYSRVADLNGRFDDVDLRFVVKGSPSSPSPWVEISPGLPDSRR
jgi:hypothetical protein